MWPAHCSWRGEISFSLPRTACSGSRMPTLPCPQMPNRYGTFCLIRYSAISSPPFIFAILPLLLVQRECDDALFGHLVDSIARTFAAEAAVFRTAVGHQVDPRAGRLVYMDAADLQAPRRREGIVQAVGEDAAGEAVGRGVDAFDRLLERI